MLNKSIKESIRESYGKIATGNLSCCAPSSSGCGCAGYADEISEQVGYSEAERSSVPGSANLGLGCGNPVALAALCEGDVVVDLGSGAGFDCFLAAQKVGDSGHVIGVDMTPEMINSARNNLVKGGYRNVEFRLGEIENLPVADNTADVIISNCVINLSTDKRKVFSEAFRVLKPEGHFMISDIVLKKELPDQIKSSVEAYIGCLSGAMLIDEYISHIKEAGFSDVTIVKETYYPMDFINNIPNSESLLEDLDITDDLIKEFSHTILSVNVSARK